MDEPGLVPTFFRFLENDEWAYQGDGGYQDLISPAILASRRLRARTGHTFAFNVELAEGAWRATAKIYDPVSRQRLLERLAPMKKAPIVATAVGTPSQELGDYLWKGIDRLAADERVVPVSLWNHSSQAVTILKHPTVVIEQWDGGQKSYRTDVFAAGQKLEYVTIKANDIGRLEVRVSMRFLEAPAEKRELRLSYLEDGSDQGLKGWTGAMRVRFGGRFRPGG